MDLRGFLTLKTKTPSPSKVNKSKSPGLSSLHKIKKLNKNKASEVKNKERKDTRSENLSKIRGIVPKKSSSTSSSQSKNTSRIKSEKVVESRKGFLERFAKYREWKAEKKAAKEKKLVFKVGKFHHKPYPTDLDDSLASTGNSTLLRSGSLIERIKGGSETRMRRMVSCSNISKTKDSAYKSNKKKYVKS